MICSKYEFYNPETYVTCTSAANYSHCNTKLPTEFLALADRCSYKSQTKTQDDTKLTGELQVW